MLNKIIDWVGDLNPQIFREFKKRLTPHNIALAIISSLVIQGLVLIYFHGQLPIFEHPTLKPAKSSIIIVTFLLMAIVMNYAN